VKLSKINTPSGARWALDGAPLASSFTLSALLTQPSAQIEEFLRASAAAGVINGTALAPLDADQEVWASGVTYLRSRDARKAESSVADVYQKVYDAERPELFMKSIGWRVRADGQGVRIRRDGTWNVPEPELVLVINAACEIVGYTAGNDMSSRDIEGENPLYLPQAKIYAGSCALGPGIRPIWEVQDVLGLDIEVEVIREGTHAWKAVTSTSLMHRSLDELVNYLFRADRFPFGAVLSTGTGLVPGMDFTLHSGDEVAITISGIGTLTNVVAEGLAAGVSSPRLASMRPAGPSPA